MIKGSEKIYAIINKEIKGYYVATHGVEVIKVDPYTTGFYGDENYPEFEVETVDVDTNPEFEISNEGQTATLKGIWSTDDEEDLELEDYRVFLAEEINLKE